MMIHKVPVGFTLSFSSSLLFDEFLKPRRFPQMFGAFTVSCCDGEKAQQVPAGSAVALEDRSKKLSPLFAGESNVLS